VLFNLIEKELAWAPQDQKKKVRSAGVVLALQSIVFVDSANGEKQ